MVSTQQNRNGPKVVIVGAGLSGMTMAIELKKRFGLESITIIERDSSVGGTWRDNTYPGCACDVPSHWYSLSSELNPDWTEAFPSQPEIQKYWESVYRKHDLSKLTRFDTAFVQGKWDSSRNTWTVELREASTGKPLPSVEADVLVSAIGGFSTPKAGELAQIPGLKTFKGLVWHSARWNWGADLKDKKVAVIGNGCSAFQFVPKLAQDRSTHIYNFSRTPAWTLPRPQYTFSPTAKWIFRRVPGVARSFRSYLYLRGDLRAFVFRDRGLGKVVRSLGERIATRYIKMTAPAKYHDFLVPKYPLGCKRIIMDPGYLASLNQDNVDLITSPIQEVTGSAILTKNGEWYDVDVVILGTGFDVTGTGVGIKLTGVDGKSLEREWQENGGPQAMKGCAVPGFPNAYMLLGPNVATGHASVIFSIEAQVSWICKLVGPMVKDGVRAWDVRRERQREEDSKTQDRLKGSVWTSKACDSYYRLPNGRVHVIWPASVTSYFWQTVVPDWSAFHQIGGDHQINDGKAPGLVTKLWEAGKEIGRSTMGLRL